MQVIDTSTGFTPILVPREIAICPICKAAIYIEHVHEWAVDNGEPMGLDLGCETEPDIDSDEWPDWHAMHFAMPYVDWLPLTEIVLKWFAANYKMIREERV